MRKTARRISNGQALRDAIKSYNGGQGITLMALRDKTIELDPDGKGVSYQLVGFLTAQSGGRARDTTSPETAALIEEALNARPGSLFNIEEVYSRSDETDVNVAPR